MQDDKKYVDTLVVSCDGDSRSPHLGHPLVYLNLGDNHKAECPYCSRVFILQE